MLNRFFGQKQQQQQQQQEPENEPTVASERAGGDSTLEEGLNPFKNSLGRTRKLFSAPANFLAGLEIPSGKTILRTICGMSWKRR